MSSKVEPEPTNETNQAITEDNTIAIEEKQKITPEYQPQGNIPALVMFTLLVGFGNL